MAWIHLVIASLLEICWMYSVRYLDFGAIKRIPWAQFGQAEFLTLLPLLGYITFGILNVIFFSMALKHIPTAVAFAIWMGVALVGATVIDWLVFQNLLSVKQILFLLLVMVGIVGLRVTTNLPG